MSAPTACQCAAARDRCLTRYPVDRKLVALLRRTVSRSIASEPVGPGSAASLCPPFPSAARPSNETLQTMAAKKTKPGYDFIVASLKKNKNASYAEIAAAAKKKSLAVYPIMYGRAKAALGLVASKPRGSKKKAVGRPASRSSRPRAPAQEPHAPTSLEGIVAAVKSQRGRQGALSRSARAGAGRSSPTRWPTDDRRAGHCRYSDYRVSSCHAGV